MTAVPDHVGAWIRWLSHLDSWQARAISQALADHKGGLAPLGGDQMTDPCRSIRALLHSDCTQRVSHVWIRWGAQSYVHPDLPGALWLLADGGWGFATVACSAEPTPESLLTAILSEARNRVDSTTIELATAYLFRGIDLFSVVAVWICLGHGHDVAQAWLLGRAGQRGRV